MLKFTTSLNVITKFYSFDDILQVAKIYSEESHFLFMGHEIKHVATSSVARFKVELFDGTAIYICDDEHLAISRDGSVYPIKSDVLYSKPVRWEQLEFNESDFSEYNKHFELGEIKNIAPQEPKPYYNPKAGVGIIMDNDITPEPPPVKKVKKQLTESLISGGFVEPKKESKPDETGISCNKINAEYHFEQTNENDELLSISCVIDYKKKTYEIAQHNQEGIMLNRCNFEVKDNLIYLELAKQALLFVEKELNY